MRLIKIIVMAVLILNFIVLIAGDCSAFIFVKKTDPANPYKVPKENMPAPIIIDENNTPKSRVVDNPIPEEFKKQLNEKELRRIEKIQQEQKRTRLLKKVTETVKKRKDIQVGLVLLIIVIVGTIFIIRHLLVQNALAEKKKQDEIKRIRQEEEAKEKGEFLG